MSDVFRAAMMELHQGQESGLVFQREGKPILGRDDDAAWYELCERAGVRRMVLHTARHTVISHLLDAGVDAELIRQFAGHSTLLSTRHYLHSSEDAMRAALDKLAG
jgi:integrase